MPTRDKSSLCGALEFLGVEPINSHQLPLLSDVADVKDAANGDRLIHNDLHSLAAGADVNPFGRISRQSVTAYSLMCQQQEFGVQPAVGLHGHHKTSHGDLFLVESFDLLGDLGHSLERCAFGWLRAIL